MWSTTKESPKLWNTYSRNVQSEKYESTYAQIVEWEMEHWNIAILGVD